MNTYYFRYINTKTGEVNIIEGYGNTRSEAYNNALEKMPPEYEMIN